MAIADLLQLAGQFGQAGLFIGYLIWRDLRAERLAEKRVEADVDLAKQLALLTAALTGRANV